MHEVRTIQDLLSQINRGEILLPEFQRGYVWSRGQVRALMQSLYRKHPTGHLLIWRTYKPSLVRGTDAPRDGHSLLLLDGQQRLTTLYVLFKGEAPRFYEGESLFFDLHFNVQTEEFRFWQKSRMERNPAWIGVHEFLNEGLTALLGRLNDLDEDRRLIIQANLPRLSDLDRIRDYTYTVDQVSGDDFNLDDVVDIFNRVNSSGTPLTKADLAVAHVCSIWPEARAELRAFSARMDERGFGVDLSFLVRCMVGVATGSVMLEGSFARTPALTLQEAWEAMQPAFEHLVSVLRREAFIAGLADLPTINVLVPATIYLARQGGQFPSDTVKRRFIRWMYLAGLWARYSGASETKLQQDVAMVAGRDLDPTYELEAVILRERGRVALEASDLERARIDSAVAHLSRVVARARDARDWFTGVRIYDRAVGQSHGEERHHVFPRKVLQAAGIDDSQRYNAIANRAILGQPAPREHRSSPAEYLPKVDVQQPGALEAQSIPLDRELWKPERFFDFLSTRRRLLAEAINTFIADWIPDDPGPVDEQGVRRLMVEGETDKVEFKSSLRWDRRDERVNKVLEGVVIKTLAGFLNAKGGTLLIGVDDTGAPVGISTDYGTLRKQNRDGFELHLQQIVTRDLGEAAAASFLTVNFHEIDGEDICQVTIEPSDHPIYVDSQQKAVFYLRSGNTTRPLPVDEAVKYVQRRWGGPA
ncbi:MAG: DUF262 domain-containing protein [Rhodospirillaceae bacterium]|nr:DUF262 domain-containing protein [Rhodospirillaceae bacterium]